MSKQTGTSKQTGALSPHIPDKLTPVQSIVIAICVLINLLDGYDILIIAYAAPSIASQWGVSPASLGILMSMGLAGMITGSLVLGPLADRFGRRSIIITCLGVAGLSLIASGFSTNLTMLSITRLITGFAIGGMLPAINTQVAEYAPPRLRSFMIAVLMTGYPLGATLGGLAAGEIIPQFGWQSVFILGGAISLVIIPLVYFMVPESISFLERKQPDGALDKINAILSKLGKPFLDTLPSLEESALKESIAQSFRRLWREHRGTLAPLMLAFFCTLMAFYFLISWTPKIMVDSGHSIEGSISIGTIMNAGGGLAVVFIGLLAMRMKPHMVAIAAMALSTIVTIFFGLSGSNLEAMMPLAFMIGIFSNSAVVGLYTIVPTHFPTELRATATGLAIGVGRIGATAGALVTGFLITAGWSSQSLYIAMSMLFTISAIAIFALARNVSKL